MWPAFDPRPPSLYMEVHVQCCQSKEHAASSSRRFTKNWMFVPGVPTGPIWGQVGFLLLQVGYLWYEHIVFACHVCQSVKWSLTYNIFYFGSIFLICFVDHKDVLNTRMVPNILIGAQISPFLAVPSIDWCCGSEDHLDIASNLMEMI